jgi:DNA replication factor Cdt1 C-terminal domain
MLAVYEISLNGEPRANNEITRSLSPFKLTVAGSSISVEFTERRKDVDGPMSTLFDEKNLHDSYRAQIYALDLAWTENRHAHLSFLGDDIVDNFPILACDIGMQTAVRKEHASKNLREILKLSNAAQLRNTELSAAKANRTIQGIPGTMDVVESRIQNLRDRIKGKELASKANAKPTSQQVLRKHALGRIGEVTDILRMMQQQQRKPESRSKTHDHTMTDFNSANGSGKVSFSLAQLQTNIRSSARIPISDAEVTVCLKLLSEELEGNWVRIVERKGALNAVFVVVEGGGMSGKEVQRQLTAKQA